MFVLLLVCFSGPSIADAWGIPTVNGAGTNNKNDIAGAPGPADPMSLANSKVTGCPFLISNVDRGMYDVPILFNEDDSRPIILFDDTADTEDDASHRDTIRSNPLVERLLRADSCRNDKRGNLRYASLHSRVGNLLCQRMSETTREAIMESANSSKPSPYIICGPKEIYTKSNAALLVGRTLGGWKRKPIRYLSLLAYTFPSKLRDKIYDSIHSGRRLQRRFKKKQQSAKADEDSDIKFNQRYVDDSILLNGKSRLSALDETSLKELKKGDRVRIVWPNSQNGGPDDPSITYDDAHENGICMVGGTATVATVDLPTRIVVKIDRASLHIQPDFYEGDIMYAWVKPSEIALL